MSSAIAALIAHAAFWALLACGLFLGELRPRGCAVFATLWIAGFGAGRIAPGGSAFFAPLVAILDIALVFTIFKGDVRL